MIKVECPGCKAPYQVDERRVPDAGLKMRCPKCATSFVVTKPGGAPSAETAPKAAAAGPKPAAAPAPKPAAAAPAPKPAAAAPKPAAVPIRQNAPTRPDVKARDVLADAEWDLPVPAAAERASAPGAPPPVQRRVTGPTAPLAPEPTPADVMDLPIVAARPAALPRGGAPAPAPKPAPARPAPAAPPAASRQGSAPAFGEIDLLVDLPAPDAPGGLDVSEGFDLIDALGAADEPHVDLPIVRPAAPAPTRGAPPPVRRPARSSDSMDLPVPAQARPAAPAGSNRSTTQLFGDSLPDPAATPVIDAPAAPIRVPVPSRAPVAKAAPPAPPVSAERRNAPTVRNNPHVHDLDDGDGGLGFGEIDLPLLAAEGDLPLHASGSNLPSPAAGLPVMAAGLPAHVEGGGLPARPEAGLPLTAFGTTLPLATDGTTLPIRTQQRAMTPMSDRLDRVSAPDLSDFREPAVHGPGHIAGADLYTGAAAYDDRHMDPAFQSTARHVSAAPDSADEAPLMTSSGASVGGRPQNGIATVRGQSLSEPRISTADSARLSRNSAPAGLGDLIDRTSIELDLIEQTAPPMPSYATGQAAPSSAPRSVSPLSFPDLAASPGASPPPAPRFDMDPLSEPASSGGSLGRDAGTEAPLEADDVGDEADLGGRGPSGRGAAPKQTASTGRTDPPPAAPRPWKKYLLVAAVAGLAVGAGLSLVPDIGPFGLNFVSDRVNKNLQNGALDDLRQRIQDDLDGDTSAGAATALAKAKTGQAAFPRHRATAGYAAFVAFSRGLRFGARPEDKGYGDMMVRVSRTKESDFLLLGQAAQDAATGQIARARQTMQGLLERRPDDIDVAVLAGEVELLAKSGDQAKKVWQQAVGIRKGTRSLFGLARAQFAAEDFIGAEASAQNALTLSPKHVGARTLLAAIVWQNGGREQLALELLSKVTEDTEIRGTAGDPELVAAYTLLGHIHLAKSRMSIAEQAFAAALKIDPQAVNALVGNGELFYRSGRYTEAVARYEAAIRADADSIPAKIGMAKTELFLERAKDAKDLLKKVCESRPTDSLAFYWLGRAEEMLGNKKEAEAAYTTAIKVGGDAPQTVESFVALAQLLSSLGRADDASARLTEAGNRFPGLAALHRARGELALTSGNYEEAKKELELALSREDDLGTKFRLATALRRMRAYDDATKLFDTIASSDQNFPGLALERGLLFEETGQSERAVEMYAKALQSAPNDLDLKLRVGSTQVMAGHAKQAEPILREVYRAKTNSAEVNHFLGRALLVRGTSLAEAKRFLERAAEIDPNRAEYHLYVGWVANELGETQQAENALKRAIELDRNLGDAYWQRGVLLQKQGQTLDALADLKIALEKSPSRFEAYATMARCYEDQSRWADAEVAWRKAIAANDDYADWHYRLGKIYADRGNKALAAPELDKAVALAEAPDKAQPGWLGNAHFLLGEAYRATSRDKAKLHFTRFLALAPANHPYRAEAEKALASLAQ